ncbi:MAG TPA: beta-ketoacyl-[acyl-carrier-protein] synthase family protein [Gammaproteobacteria bacterium]|nr:beta-ketoacyl-[acyl-carrier-protein] synthase family protein [Gammaproteobacteria bacterium]
MKTNVYLNQLGMICSLGNNIIEIKQNLLNGKIFDLRDTLKNNLPSHDHLPLRDRSRNNQLALGALEQIFPAVEKAIQTYGPHRIGIIVGTSTSGISNGELAFNEHKINKKFPDDFHYGQQELGSPARALAKTLGISGPVYTHSSACSSSGKAMASAARLIQLGVCDAVLTGGVDSLCEFTQAGFASLESISPTRCNPFSANRNGITIGEGAALFLMTKEPSDILLSGWGESSDAYHISAPDPAGTGAIIAIQKALSRAGITPKEIDYINLHGTATLQNDAMESQVIHQLFGDKIFASSTKALTGHTLGAASAIEAGLCWLTLHPENATGALPPQIWDGIQDPRLPILRFAEIKSCLGRPLNYILSNSFAFGGSNIALILGRT